jgi:hypothetical protein
LAFLSSTPFVTLLYKMFDAHFLVLILFLMNDDMLISSSFHQMLLTFKIPIILLCWSYLQLTFFVVGNCILCQGWSRKRAKSNAGALLFFSPVFCSSKKTRITLKFHLHFSTWREESVSMTRRYPLISTRYEQLALNCLFFQNSHVSLMHVQEGDPLKPAVMGVLV